MLFRIERVPGSASEVLVAEATGNEGMVVNVHNPHSPKALFDFILMSYVAREMRDVQENVSGSAVKANGAALDAELSGFESLDPDQLQA